MNMKEINKINKWKITTISLIVIVVLVCSYLFVISPKIKQIQTTNYEKGFQDGYGMTINTIISSLNQLGYVEIKFGDNQSIILVPQMPK